MKLLSRKALWIALGATLLCAAAASVTHAHWVYKTQVFRGASLFTHSSEANFPFGRAKVIADALFNGAAGTVSDESTDKWLAVRAYCTGSPANAWQYVWAVNTNDSIIDPCPSTIVQGEGAMCTNYVLCFF